MRGTGDGKLHLCHLSGVGLGSGGICGGREVGKTAKRKLHRKEKYNCATNWTLGIWGTMVLSFYLCWQGYCLYISTLTNRVTFCSCNIHIGKLCITMFSFLKRRKKLVIKDNVLSTSFQITILNLFLGKIKSSAWDCSCYSASTTDILNNLKNNIDRRKNDIFPGSQTKQSVWYLHSISLMEQLEFELTFNMQFSTKIIIASTQNKLLLEQLWIHLNLHFVCTVICHQAL